MARKAKKLILIILLGLLILPIISAAYQITPAMIKERYGFRTIFIDEKSNTYNVSEMSTEEIILSLSNKNGESYVIINGNVKCKYNNFVNGVCGNEFVMGCVPNGEDVWQFEECCEGKPYLSYGFVGQLSCRDFNYRFGKDIKYNPVYWLIGLIILVGIIYLIYKNVKKK